MNYLINPGVVVEEVDIVTYKFPYRTRWMKTPKSLRPEPRVRRQPPVCTLFRKRASVITSEAQFLQLFGNLDGTNISEKDILSLAYRNKLCRGFAFGPRTISLKRKPIKHGTFW